MEARAIDAKGRRNTLIDDVETAMEHIRHDIVGDILDHVSDDLESVERHVHDLVLEMLHRTPEEVASDVSKVLSHIRDQTTNEVKGWVDSALTQLDEGNFYDAAAEISKAAYAAYENDPNRINAIELFHSAARIYKIDDASSYARLMEDTARDILV